METPALRDLVAAIAFLHGKGWTPATSSNFSVRRNSASFLVSESGRDKGAFTTECFLPVDMGGATVDDERRRPSAETLLHAAVYERAPEVACVLHTHSPHATVVSLLQEGPGALTIAGFEVLKGLQGLRSHEASVTLPVFPNTQDMAALHRDVGAWLDRESAEGRPTWGYLIAGHGLYAWGASVAEAKRHIEVFEFLFECLLKLERHGVPLQPARTAR